MIDRELKLYKLKDFRSIKSFFEANGKFFTAAIDLQGDFLEEIKSDPDKYYIDITQWVENLNVHRDLIHNMQGLLNLLPEEITFLCEDKLSDLALDIFRHNFVSSADLDIQLPEEAPQTPTQEDVNVVKKLVDLKNEELSDFLEYINKNLIGHKKFKEELAVRLKSFKLFHKLGEQKVFSIFLMGESGIGKTEVGRLMHKALESQKSLCKISFGNYSSKDSLNSLIGSPRGYMGSETGELPMKIERSDIGIILIDEFEKADNPVFNFFLDLLEEGKFTDSQSNVYDLDGYLIIFTSNLSPENYKKRLSPELRSRFDYVCQFQLLTDKEKKDYMYKRIEVTIKKFEEKLNVTISKEDKAILYSIDYSSLNNLRKINRAIKEKFAEISKAYIS